MVFRLHEIATQHISESFPPSICITNQPLCIPSLLPTNCVLTIVIHGPDDFCPTFNSPNSAFLPFILMYFPNAIGSDPVKIPTSCPPSPICKIPEVLAPLIGYWVVPLRPSANSVLPMLLHNSFTVFRPFTIYC